MYVNNEAKVETIDDSQLKKLISICKFKNIDTNWIKGICGVNNIDMITVKQYSFLLLLFSSIYGELSQIYSEL